MTFVSDLLAALSGEWWSLAAMTVLIGFSAFFSGSEAALFSLQEKQRRHICTAGATGKRVGALLNQPDRLLSAILFWNLLINMTYFAIAAGIGGRLDADSHIGSTGAVVFTIVSLLTIIFLSEMLPKSIAVLSPVRVAFWIATPMNVALQIVSPVLPIVRAANVGARRLFWPTFQPEPELDLADIERAIELGTDDAALLQRERNALRELIAMSETRADELMRPRSRLELITLPISSEWTPSQRISGGYVYVTSSDDETIVGSIHTQMLRPSQWEDLKEACEPVLYLAWSAKISQVFDQLMEEEQRVAIVVNEFGESIGAISVEDILRSILAPRNVSSGDDDTMIALPDGRWRLTGTLSLRVLTKQLELDEPVERTATVAGFIQRFNERLPRIGDSATLGRFRLTVINDDGDKIWIEASPDGADDTTEIER